jgi:hypothetical protein
MILLGLIHWEVDVGLIPLRQDQTVANYCSTTAESHTEQGQGFDEADKRNDTKYKQTKQN